jgi:hypothetical protein
MATLILRCKEEAAGSLRLFLSNVRGCQADLLCLEAPVPE